MSDRTYKTVHSSEWDRLLEEVGYGDAEIQAHAERAINGCRKAFEDSASIYRDAAGRSKQIQYQEATHWALINMHGSAMMDIDFHTNLIRALFDRIVTLEAKIAESSRGMEYRGAWKLGEFEKGDVVTHHGSAWHCNQRTTDQPGTNSSWTLMVKKGRDAK